MTLSNDPRFNYVISGALKKSFHYFSLLFDGMEFDSGVAWKFLEKEFDLNPADASSITFVNCAELLERAWKKRSLDCSGEFSESNATALIETRLERKHAELMVGPSAPITERGGRSISPTVFQWNGDDPIPVTVQADLFFYLYSASDVVPFEDVGKAIQDDGDAQFPVQISRLNARLKKLKIPLEWHTSGGFIHFGSDRKCSHCPARTRGRRSV